MTTKHCQHCGDPFEKGPRNSAEEWAVRKYCSRRCSARANPPERRSAAERLEIHTDKSPGHGSWGNCWIWTAGLKQGYGHMRDDDNRYTTSHRVAFELAKGKIPPGAFICHRCDNPACVRPGHLFLGDNAANMADMSKKGRAARGEKNFRAVLTSADVQSIRSDPRSNAALGPLYGVSAPTISKIKHRRLWAHV